MVKLRLSKLMSQRGICSRREADRFIEQGWVMVDGEWVTELGAKVEDSQSVTLAEDARHAQQRFITVLVNKPRGYVSGTPEKGYPSALTLVTGDNRRYAREPVPSRKGMAPAGRLDIDSMGLLVFTQDGRVAKRLIGPQSEVEKEYLVWVKGEITRKKLAMLRHGLILDDRPLRPATVDLLKGSQLRFILTEGRKRQIRRMCERVELQVSRLIRVRIGDVKLGRLESGTWRLLRPDESF